MYSLHLQNEINASRNVVKWKIIIYIKNIFFFISIFPAKEYYAFSYKLHLEIKSTNFELRNKENTFKIFFAATAFQV